MDASAAILHNTGDRAHGVFQIVCGGIGNIENLCAAKGLLRVCCVQFYCCDRLLNIHSIRELADGNQGDIRLTFAVKNINLYACLSEETCFFSA